MNEWFWRSVCYGYKGSVSKLVAYSGHIVKMLCTSAMTLMGAAGTFSMMLTTVVAMAFGPVWFPVKNYLVIQKDLRNQATTIRQIRQSVAHAVLINRLVKQKVELNPEIRLYHVLEKLCDHEIRKAQKDTKDCSEVNTLLRLD